MPYQAHSSYAALQDSEAGFAAILLESDWISERDLAAAREYARREQLDLVEAIVALRLIDEHDSYAALSIAAGVEFVDLNEAELSVLAILLVPPALAFERMVVPITVNNHVLTFATCRPFIKDTKRELMLATGRQARMTVAQRSSVVEALNHCYTGLEPIQSLLDLPGGHRTAGPNTVERAVSEGTTPPDAGTVPPGRANEPLDAKRRHRVLVTDDDPLTRIVVRLLLQKQHFEVIEAADGRQALELAVRTGPDVVLMDLNMPEMDGYEAIARLRQDQSTAQVPIVVLTGEEAPEIEHRVLHLGANDYIVKPFDPEMLISRAQAAVRRRRGISACAALPSSWSSSE